MIDTIGFLELTSIAKGIEAADQMLKKASVELLFAKPLCPGKYVVLVAGETSEVESAIVAGEECGSIYTVQSVLVPRLHPQVLQAINLCAAVESVQAVGVMEFFSIAEALQAADSAVKAADVDLLDIRLGAGVGGKSFVLLTGETAAVEQAIAVGVSQAEKNGMLVCQVVIPNPTPEIITSLY